MANNDDRYRIAHRLVGNAIWDWNITDNEQWWSPETYALLGIDPATPASTEVFDRFVHPEDLVTARRTFVEAVGCDSSEWGYEFRVRRAGGEYAQLVNRAVIMRDADGQPVRAVGVMQDVTDRRALESHVLQAARGESLGRMALGISHDFNNLLTVIVGYLQLIEQDAGPRSSIAAQAAIALRAANQGAELTGQLLAYARKQYVQPRVIEVQELMSRSRPLLEQLVGDSVQLEVDIHSELWLIKIDPTQFDQVLMNLAANARDAMPSGGRLQLVARNERLDRDTDREWAPAGGEFVRVSVSDTSGGMPEHIAERVFEPFFTTKGVGDGTGLGLATAAGIIRQCGGHIGLASEPDRGTTLTFWLPRCTTPDQRAHEFTSSPRPRLQSPGEQTLLVVEDDALVRDLIDVVLSREGYRVLLAADGQAALELVNSREEAVDLVITDLTMPRLGGVELVEQLRLQWGDVRVLFTSGCPPELAAIDADFLPKPYQLDDLRKAVHDLLDASRAPGQEQAP